jgi:hypothetical protein
LLSAAIFTTTPLLAMEDEDGITPFMLHNKDAAQVMISYLDLPALESFAKASKTNYKACLLPLYGLQAQKWGIAINPTDTLGERLSSYRNSFLGEQDQYKITIGHIKSIAATPIFTGDPSLPTWKFSIGNKSFTLTNPHHHPDMFNNLDNGATLTFSRDAVPGFYATLLICGHTAGVTDLSDPEYVEIAQKACEEGNFGVPDSSKGLFNKNPNSVWCYLPGHFNLHELDEETIPEKM